MFINKKILNNYNNGLNRNKTYHMVYTENNTHNTSKHVNENILQINWDSYHAKCM